MFKRIIRPAFVASVAAVALASVAAVSAASPAETTNYRECGPDGDTGNTICYTIHDVEKSSTNEAGVSKTSASGKMLIEYFDADGNLLWNDQTRWHDNEIQKDGVTQVYKAQTNVKYYYEGETCTNAMNVTFANGEVRHLGPEWEWDCK